MLILEYGLHKNFFPHSRINIPIAKVLKAIQNNSCYVVVYEYIASVDGPCEDPHAIELKRVL